MATTTRTTKKTAPRKPQDRKPPAAPAAEKPTVETGSDLITVKVRDLELKIDPETMDDFELLDDLNALDQKADATRMPSVLRRFVGDEQWPIVMDALRDKTTKRVSVEDGSEFVWELVEALNPNSSSS